MQNYLRSTPKRKITKILQKSLISMHPKSTPISIYVSPKMVKNHPKSSIIILKEHPKTLQNLFFLGIPKWIFISGPGNLAHEKMVGNHPKSSIITLKAPNSYFCNLPPF
jgi:hypothetical protein